MINSEERKDLEEFALKIRIGTMESIRSRGFGHVGGSLSIAELLAVLYGKIMKYDVSNPQLKDRDKLVCSKGHAGPAVYATLGLAGFFPYDDIKTLNKNGTNFPSHCDKNKTTGIDCTTGSLGQGSSQAVGIALGDRLRGHENRVFLVVGDGELDEGQCWEAIMFTGTRKLSNLVWIVDNNMKQLDGFNKDIIDLGVLEEKFRSFGFEAIGVDGHDVSQLSDALSKKTNDKPIAIIMHTIKGKGIKEVENIDYNHSITTDDETFKKWINELKKELSTLDDKDTRKVQL